MKINVFYYTYLYPNHWEKIVTEQLQSLKECGLYDFADKIYITITSNKQDLDKLTKLIENNYNKIKILKYSLENKYEYYGIKSLYDMSEKNSVNLYFHTKGVTSGITNKNNNNIRLGLFNYLIKDFKKILSEFNINKDLDICTLIPHERGFGYYNFFWVRGEYLKKYCQIPTENSNRFYWEEWLGKPHSKKDNIITYSPLLNYEKVNTKDEVIKIRNKYLI
jgi:hypothetical protein